MGVMRKSSLAPPPGPGRADRSPHRRRRRRPPAPGGQRAAPGTQQRRRRRSHRRRLRRQDTHRRHLRQEGGGRTHPRLTARSEPNCNNPRRPSRRGRRCSSAGPHRRHQEPPNGDQPITPNRVQSARPATLDSGVAPKGCRGAPRSLRPDAVHQPLQPRHPDDATRCSNTAGQSAVRRGRDVAGTSSGDRATDSGAVRLGSIPSEGARFLARWVTGEHLSIPG